MQIFIIKWKVYVQEYLKYQQIVIIFIYFCSGI